MSVLSSASVRARTLAGDVSIAPLAHTFFDDTVASIDLRLGRWFATMRDNRLSMLNVGKGEFEARKHVKETFVPFGGSYFLHPGRFVLAATLEWVTLPRDLMGLVTGKSSWARRGLSVEGAPGVHPCFSGCLTLEVSNHGVVPIELRSGMRICQLFLVQVQIAADQSEGQPKDQKKTIYGMRRKPTIGVIEVDEIVDRLVRSL